MLSVRKGVERRAVRRALGLCQYCITGKTTQKRVTICKNCADARNDKRRRRHKIKQLLARYKDVLVTPIVNAIMERL